MSKKDRRKQIPVIARDETVMRSYRLSKEALELIERLQEYAGGQTATYVLEWAVRELARREGV